jgi:multiple sugar transport system permease protein
MKEKNIKRIFILSGSIFMLVFCLTPFVFMVVISFSENPDFLGSGIGFKFVLDNYQRILTVSSLHFLDYLRNSIIISGISAFFAVLIAGLAAYAITRLAFAGKVLIMFFVLAISMFPQISIVSYLYRFMESLGWINTYAALVFPYIAWILPLSLWILVSYFAQIPKDLDRAGLVDGCSRFQVLRKIVFPIAAPGLFSTGLLAFVLAFNEFMFAVMLTTDHHSRTVPVGIALFQGLHGEIPWGTIMSASAIATLPVVAGVLIFQRQIIQGITRGAVKG